MSGTEHRAKEKHAERNEHDIYRIFEEYWGEPLSHGLARRIAQSSRRQLENFSDWYEPRVNAFRPRDLKPGELCPAAGSNIFDIIHNRDSTSVISNGINLLLYTHSVVVDHPVSPVDVTEGGEKLRKKLDFLLRVKPLHDLGALQFAVVTSRTLHPSLAGGYPPIKPIVDSVELSDPELIQAAEKAADNEESIVESIVAHITGSMATVSMWKRGANTLIRSRDEFNIRNLMVNSIENEPGRPAYTLGKLHGLHVPNVTSDVENLVALRENEEAFADWRHYLGQAIRDIENLPDWGEKWQKAAGELLSDVMSPLLSRAKKASRKSPAVSALTYGSKEFGIAATGVASGAMATGTVLGPTLTAMSVQAVRALREWLRVRSEVRGNRAIVDLSVTMYEDLKSARVSS